MAQLVEALCCKPQGRGFEPIPVAERSKARVCGRSLVGVACVFVFCVASKDKKAKSRTGKTQKQVRVKHKGGRRESEKFLWGV